MAVNIANGLYKELSFSALVTTRNEGALKKNINTHVVYSFLNKKSIFDIKAILRFRTFLIINKIEIIHAHGTSYFFAVLVKLIYPNVKILWHDHNGNRVNIKKTNIVLKLFSFLFIGVFTVNKELEKWANKELYCKKIYFIPNFAVINSSEKATTILNGKLGKRIICLANLRKPKNHITLLKSFSASNAKSDNWTLHLIGADKKDNYSDELKEFIIENKLENHVFIYGGCNDISLILKQGNIGVLVSTYEGFPVTLLEYGMSRLAVISTNVGYCKSVVQNEISGLLFNPYDENELTKCLNVLINNKLYREKLSINLHTFVTKTYSESAILKKIIQAYNKIF